MRGRKYWLLTALVALILCLALSWHASAAPHGDFNNDQKVGSQDALYLLRHVLNPEGYPVDQSADVNGDGAVNSQDALYLLRHSLHPTGYPLAADHELVELPGYAATCTEDGLTSGWKCTVCHEVIQPQTVIPATGHRFVDRVCVHCGEGYSSQGLQMELLPDSSGYRVVGIGDCTDTDIVVPSTYQGLPVTAIGSGAFSGSGFTSVTLGENITTIASGAFYECADLTRIVILQPDVAFDGKQMVYECGNLKQVLFAGDPVYWEQQSVYLGETVEVVTNYGHNYSGTILTAATCVRNGITQYTCRDCGRSYQQETEALGHYYDPADCVEPTCTEDGSVDGACTRCGVQRTGTLPATGHTVESYTVREAPTCSSEGSELGYCTTCEQWLERTLPMLSHTPGDFVGSGVFCGTRELGSASCTVCGQTAYAVEHLLSTETIQPTCFEDGAKITTCSNCDYTQRVAVPASDHMAGAWVVLQESTCAAEGAKVKTCIECAVEMERQVLSKKDHVTIAQVVGDTCTYRCQDCDYTYAVSVENKHTVTLVSGCDPELAPLYVEDGGVPLLPTPALEDMMFLGWYWDEDMTTPYEDTPITGDVTLYAAWMLEKVSVSDNAKPGVVHADDVNYQFAVQSSVPLTDNNINDYIVVTSSDQEIIPIFVVRSEGDTYYIGGQYAAGDIYEAAAIGNVTFADSDTDHLWFVIDGAMQGEATVSDGTVQIHLNQVLSEYSEGDYEYLLLAEDWLNVGQIALIVGDGEGELYAMYEVLAETMTDGVYRYRCKMADPADVFDEYTLFTQQELDLSEVELDEDWEQTVIDEFKRSQTYTAFYRTVEKYAQQRSNESKYIYTMKEPTFKPNFKLKDGQLIFTVQTSIKVERKSKVTGTTIDMLTLTMNMESRLGLTADFSAQLKRGNARAVVTTRTETTIDFLFAFGLEDDDKAQEKYFRDLYKDVTSKKDLLPIDTVPVGDEVLVPVAYVPIPLPYGFALDMELYLMLDWEISGQFNVNFHHTSTLTMGVELNRWKVKTVAHSSNDYTVSVLLSGRLKAGAGIRPEIGINWCKIVRVGINGTISGYVEVGGAVGFVWSKGQTIQPLYTGYLEAGIELALGMNAQIGYGWLSIGGNWTLFSVKIPLVDIGCREVILNFENDGEKYYKTLDYDDYYDLTDLVDMDVRVQNVISMAITTKEVEEYTFELLEAVPNVTVTADGIVMIRGCDETEFELKLRVTSKRTYKDVYVRITIDHDHSYSVEKDDGGCLNPTILTYSCRYCSYQYSETVAAPGHDYGEEKLGKAPTCTADGYTYIACSRGDDVITTVLPAIGHDYTVQDPQNKYQHLSVTCYRLASYYYACANCGGADPIHTYEYGEMLSHVYTDEFTCHDRSCLREGCTHEEVATTEHPMTGEVVVPDGGCAVDGFTMRMCRDCHAVEADGVLLDEEQHAHNFELQPDKAPTCTEPGYKDSIVCTRCGVIPAGTPTVVPALGHNIVYRDITDDTHTQYCIYPNCGYVSEPMEHNHTGWTTIIQPGCVTEGVEMGTCVCGHSATKETEAKGHKPAKQYEYNDYQHYRVCTVCAVPVEVESHDHSGPLKAEDDKQHYRVCGVCTAHIDIAYHEPIQNGDVTDPTCTKDGYTPYRCDLCAHTWKESIPMLGHDWNNATIDKDDNQHWLVCGRGCGATANKTAHTKEWYVVQPATCTEEGEKRYDCPGCGHQGVDSIPKEDHLPGDLLYDDVRHYRVCATCLETIEPANHKPVKNGAVKEPTCAEGGYTPYRCSVCDYTWNGDLTDPVPHDTSGAWAADDTHHWKVCTLCGTEVDKTAHDGEQGYDNEQHYLSCAVCKETYDKQAHVGMEAWKVDKDKGQHYHGCDACDYERDRADHAGEQSYDDAKHYYVCAACNATYGEQAHEGVDRWKSDADEHYHGCDACGYETDRAAHTSDGGWHKDNAAYHYYVCDECGAEYNKQDHVGMDVWKSDADGHYHSCDACGYETDRAAHTSDGGWRKDNAAYHYYVCDECGAEYNRQAHVGMDAWKSDADGHYHSCDACGYETDRTAHTSNSGWHNDNSAYHYYVCDECGAEYNKQAHVGMDEWKSDTDGHYHSCDVCGYETARAAHTSNSGWHNDNSAYHYYVCDKCGAEYNQQDHVGMEAWKSDADEHYHSCDVCGYETDRAAHTSDGGWHKDNAAYHYYVCDECGAEYNKQDHVGMDEWKSDADGHYRSCDACGYEADHATHTSNSGWHNDNSAYHYYVCDKCGAEYNQQDHVGMEAWKSDADGHYHSCDICGYETDRTAHTSDGVFRYDADHHYYVCDECGELYNVTEHDFSGAWMQADAYHWKQCAACGATAIGEHTHDNKWYPVDDTAHDRVCTVCGKHYNSMYHVPDEGTPTPPTCTDEGYTTYRCIYCYHQWDADHVAPYGHAYQQQFDAKNHWDECDHCHDKKDSEQHDLYETVILNPTCYEKGTLYHKCLDCRYAYETDIQPGHDHSGEWQYSDAQHYRICGVCGEEIDHIDHAHNWVKRVDFTCTQDGYDLYRCVCGHEKKKNEVAAHHVGMDKWVQTETQHYHGCTRCDYEIDRADHVYGGWETITPAACEKDGWEERTCGVCGYVDGRIVPLFHHEYEETVHTDREIYAGGYEYLITVGNECTICHNFVPIGTTIQHIHDQVDHLPSKAPTCTEAGWTTGVVCAVSDCRKVIIASELIDALGHVWLDGHCTRCGEIRLALEYTLSSDGTYYVVTGIGNIIDTTVVIPATHEGLPVLGIGYGAFEGNTAILRVEIAAGITWIDSHAFYGCTALQSVVIPEGVVEIGAEAFCGCTSLQTVSLPGSLLALGRAAFKDCRSLLAISFGGNKLAKIEPETFQNCGSLSAINVPEGITEIGMYAFDNCYGLKAATLPATLTTIGGSAFYGCHNLSALVLPDNLTTLGDMAFYNCRALKAVTVPDGVTRLGYGVFGGCNGMVTLTLPATLTEIGDSALYYCTALNYVYFKGTSRQWKSIPKGTNWDTDCTFTVICWGNDALTLEYTLSADGTYYIVSGIGTCEDAVEIPAYYDGLPVKAIGKNAFKNVTDLTEVTFEEGSRITEIGMYAFYGCTGLTEIDLPEGVVTIGAFAFQKCSNLETVYIPDTVTDIGASAFRGCASLQYVILPEGVTSIAGFAFAQCSSIDYVYIPAGVTIINGYAFQGCTTLTDITIPAGVTTIDLYAFANCTALEVLYYEGSYAQWQEVTKGTNWDSGCTFTVEILGEDESALEFEISEDGTYYNVTGIGSFTGSVLEIPATYHGLPVKGIGRAAFCGCDYLTEVVIPDSVTYIGCDAFACCESLPSIIIPDSVTTLDSGAFCLCTGLTEVILPDSVTYIGERAFEQCTGLTSIILPEGVTYIGDFAFLSCSALTRFTVPGGITYLGEEILHGCTGLTELTLPFTGACAQGGSLTWGSLFNSGYFVTDSEPEVMDKIILLGGDTVCDFAFCGSTARTIVLPDTVQSIGDGAFQVCAYLTELTIPASVTSIGIGVFEVSYHIEVLRYDGTKDQWEALTDGVDWCYKYYLADVCTVICSDGTVACGTMFSEGEFGGW